jgi:hypothetical protein
MKRPTPWKARIVVVGVTGVASVVGWLLLGSPGVVLGGVAGLTVTQVVLGILMACTVPAGAGRMVSYEPELALREARYGLWARRALARWWPGRFREVLAAERLMEAEALWALGEYLRVPGSAREAVAIYRDLAARGPQPYEAGLAQALDRQARLLAATGAPGEAAAVASAAAQLYRALDAAAPGKYRPALAGSLILQAVALSKAGLAPAALVAAAGAASVCEDGLPPCAARAFVQHGRLLAGRGRHREAAGQLARGWQLAIRWGEDDMLESAVQALRDSYRVDRAAVLDAWRTEVGGDPPDWLTGARPLPGAGS